MKIILVLLLAAFMVTAKTEEVSITVNDVNIRGTLEVPDMCNSCDVVLIIAGSGPTDRDGNSSMLPGKNNSLKMLAELLYENGIASLRYDKRGIGESDKVVETELTFETYINEAVEWINYLRNDERFTNVIVVGHSEGSLIGMVAAEKINADKFVSLCGAGKPIYEILDEQVVVKNQLPEEMVKEFRSSIDSLKQGEIVKDVNSAFVSLFRPSVQPYMISWFKYDPQAEIAKLDLPVLIIGGTTDLQVDTTDAYLLAESQPNSRLEIIKDMNHILKEVPTLDRGENFKSYSNEALPLSDELCKILIEFVKGE